MNEALKTLAGLVDFVYGEISRISMDNTLDDKAYLILRESAIDAINLRQKILDARGWNITAERAKKD
jgi:hypothetical protein